MKKRKIALARKRRQSPVEPSLLLPKTIEDFLKYRSGIESVFIFTNNPVGKHENEIHSRSLSILSEFSDCFQIH